MHCICHWCDQKASHVCVRIFVYVKPHLGLTGATKEAQGHRQKFSLTWCTAGNPDAPSLLRLHYGCTKSSFFTDQPSLWCQVPNLIVGCKVRLFLLMIPEGRSCAWGNKTVDARQPLHCGTSWCCRGQPVLSMCNLSPVGVKITDPPWQQRNIKNMREKELL